MAYGNPNSDYYPSDDAAPSQAGSSEGTEPPKGDEDEKDEGVTALLPKSILAGKEFQPGEEVVLKIVHIYDDEVEVAYATGEESDEKEEGGDSPTMKKAMSSMGEY